MNATGTLVPSQRCPRHQRAPTTRSGPSTSNNSSTAWPPQIPTPPEWRLPSTHGTPSTHPPNIPPSISQGGRPMVRTPLGTRGPHGSRGLLQRSRTGVPPERPTTTTPSQHHDRPRGRPMKSTVHRNLLCPRISRRSRHTGTHGCLDHAGKRHQELPPPPPVGPQPAGTTMAHKPPRASTETRQPHTKPREGDCAYAGGSSAVRPRSTSYPPLFLIPPTSGPATSSPTKTKIKKTGHARPYPPTNQNRQQGNDLPSPPQPPQPLPPTRRRHTGPPANSDQASSSSYFAPPAPPQPDTYQEF